MQSSRKFIGVTAVVGATAILGSGAVTAAPLDWTDCGSVVGVPAEDVPPGIECAQLQVPVSYADPGGTRTTIAVSRVRAASGTARSTVFGNPGGPGVAALSYWTPRGDGGPADLYRDHDLVAVQPRGLAGSTPLACDPGFVGPVTVRALHDACFGTDARYQASMTTETMARDMDAVREAMGLSTIDYVGQSYGTAIGADFATLFPQHTGRFVLDSNVDPSARWGRMSALSTRAQEARVHDLFGWIASRDDYYHLGDTPLKVFTSWKWIVDQEVGGAPNLTPPAAVALDLPPELRGTALEGPALDAVNATAPGRARVEGFVRAVTLRDVANNASTGLFDATVGATANDRAWPMIAHMLRYYNDGGRIARVDFQTAQKITALKENRPEVLDSRASLFTTVTCNENATPVNLLGAVAARVDSHLGGNALVDKAAWEESGGHCLGYAPVTRPVAPSGAALETPPLLLNSERDPLTPLSGAQVMRQMLGGTLVTVGGGTHGTFRSGNPLVDELVVRYLAGEDVDAGTVPGRPAPQPMPRYGPAERAAAENSRVSGTPDGRGGAGAAPASTPRGESPAGPDDSGTHAVSAESRQGWGPERGTGDRDSLPTVGYLPSNATVAVTGADEWYGVDELAERGPVTEVPGRFAGDPPGPVPVGLPRAVFATLVG